MAVFTAAAALGASILGAAAGTFTFATVAVGFLAQAALGLALNALTPKPKTKGANRGYQVNSRGSALDHQIIYGEVRVGGALVFESSIEAGAQQFVNNQFLYQIYAHAGHPVEDYIDVYIDDLKVTKWRLASDKSSSGGPSTVANGVGLVPVEVCNVDSEGNVINGTCKGTYIYNNSNNMVLRFYDGTQTTADGTLVNDIPEWTQAHVLRNTAYMAVLYGYDPNVYPNGVPEVTCTIRGKKVYDPRDGSTAWSDNPALCLNDYLTNSYGLNEPQSNVDVGLVGTAANVCDSTATDGSTFYTCNGSFVTSLAPYDLLSDLLTSMGGLLWYAQGEWRMKPAYWVAPTLTLDENDLRSSVTVQTRHSRRDNFNIVKGTFRGPESNWQVTDYPEVTNVTDTTTVSAGSFVVGDIYKIIDFGTTTIWNDAAGTTGNPYAVGDYFVAANAGSGDGVATETRNAYLDTDGGQESVIDFDLPFTDTASEARRLARIMLERNRQQLTVSASFGLRAFQTQVGDVIKLSVDRFGWDEKHFEVTSWTFGLADGSDLQVQMVLREISENVFDEVDDGVFFESDNGNPFNPFFAPAPTNLVVTPKVVTRQDGTTIGSFEVEWGAPTANAFAGQYSLEWKKLAATVYNSTLLDTTDFEIFPVEENESYNIRVKAINRNDVSSDYIETTASVGPDSTAPSAPTSVTATGGFKYITVAWTNPPETDFSYVEVYENTSNTTSGASLVGESSGNQFTRTNLGISETKWYFLKAVDYSGNKSVFSAGASGTTTFLDDPDFENGIRTLFEEQGLYPIEDVNGLPPSGTLNRKVFNRQDGKLYEWNGSSWVLVVSSVEAPDISGQLATNQIALDAVTNALIANDAIQAENIQNLAINADKIASNSITTTKIADGSIETPKIATNAITATQISAGTITASEIATGAITATQISTGTITASEIATRSITAQEIATGSITANEITADTITSNEIDTGAITATEIATNTITADEIEANTITGGLLATSGIITQTAQIENGLITNAKIDDLAVDNAKIGNAEVDTLKVAGEAITAPQFTSSASTLTGNGQLQTAMIGAIDVPGNTTAHFLVVVSFAQGYPNLGTNPVPKWGFSIEGPASGAVFERYQPAMSAVNDYPSVSFIGTVTNTSSTKSAKSVVVKWYGENSDIELGSSSTISILARWR